MESRSDRRSRPLGRVWISCSYPLLRAGLVKALSPRARVYAGQEPPLGENPSFVILCAENVDDLNRGLDHVHERAPGAKTLLLSVQLDLPLARLALRRGVRGFIHAGMSPDQIFRSLDVIARGELAVPRNILEALALDDGKDRPRELPQLTPRQREILELVAEGLTNAQIAGRLHLSESSVKQHLRGAYRALNVRNRTEAANLVRNAGDGPLW